MFHLEIQPARTTSQLRSAANPTELDAEGYEVEDGYVIVETQAEADALMSRYSNLELDLGRGAEANDDMPRATLTDDGVERSDGEPGICDAVMDSGDVCGRELPCQYHS